jgi:hypothetical protein
VIRIKHLELLKGLDRLGLCTCKAGLALGLVRSQGPDRPRGIAAARQSVNLSP